MTYLNLKKHMQRIADVNYASAVLSWDQEVFMPVNGAEARARQLSTLAGIAHEMFVSEKTKNLLNESINGKLTENEKINIERLQEDLKLKTKYTTEFVEALSACTSASFNAWQEAKNKNNFQIFAPQLKKMIELKRKEAEIIGYKKSPYNALLDLYEKKCTTEKLDKLFDDVQKQLVPFVKNITKKKSIDNSFLFYHYNKQKQWEFGIDVLKKMNYDFNSGRQDQSSHPFTTNFNTKDVRITTRVTENDFAEMLWSSIHEGGHALYEQGLSDEEYGMPLGEYTSLGIHESQSRLWENHVGRSASFWKYYYPILQTYFPECLNEIKEENFYAGINKIEPGLIRTSADELTYHFHVMIRYELEKALIEGTLEVDELPKAWNKKYKDYLGLEVPNDAKGVLQDIHWSHGSFGYFPTYSVGSFYAAQFYSAASKVIPDLELKISKGDYQELLLWLRKNIHQYGRKYTADELCKMATGEELNFSYFMDYVHQKYSGIYP
jgi:carboxypeptidase Taq